MQIQWWEEVLLRRAEAALQERDPWQRAPGNWLRLKEYR